MQSAPKSKKKEQKNNELEFSRLLKTASTAIKSLPSKQHFLKKRSSQKKSRSVKRQKKNPQSNSQTSRVQGLVLGQKALAQSRKKYKKCLESLNSYYSQLQQGLKQSRKRAQIRIFQLHKKNEQQIAIQIQSIGKLANKVVSSFSKQASRCIDKLHYPKPSNKTSKIIRLFQQSLGVFEPACKDLGISEINPLDTLGQDQSLYASPFKCVAG